jgi:hypothetical protein
MFGPAVIGIGRRPLFAIGGLREDRRMEGKKP